MQRYIIAMGFILMSSCLWAQDDGELAPEKIDVVKEYEPVLGSARKVEISPDLNDKDATGDKDVQAYDLPQKFLSIDFEPVELKPLSAKKISPKLLNNFWLKAGYGSLSNPELDITASTGRNNRMSLGINGNFEAVNGTELLQKHQHAGGKVFGNFFLDALDIDTEVKYNRRQHFYFGTLDSTDTETSISEDSLKILYQKAGGAIRASSKFDSELEWNTGLRYNRQFDLKESTEDHIYYSAEATRYFDAFGLGANLWVDYNNYKTDTVTLASYTNTLLTLNPEIKVPSIGLSLGTNIVFSGDEPEFFPDVTFEKNLGTEAATLYGGWEKWAHKNTWTALSEQNPFLSDATGIDLENSTIEDRYAGLRGLISGKVSYNLKVIQQLTDNQAFFRADSTETKKFNMFYSDTTIMNIIVQPQIQVTPNNQLGISLGAKYIVTADSSVQLYHLPTLSGQAKIDYTLDEKLSFYADGIYWNERKGNSAQDDLEAIIDLGIGATYRLNENISLFLDLDNILGNKYERWSGYKAYGFSGIGGIKLKL